MLRYLPIVLVLAMLAAPALAARVALIVGNDEYDNPEFNLKNPANDARALSGELARLGYSVTTLINARRSEAEAALERFEAEMTNAQAALLFFAGHGVQIDGENYLLTSSFRELELDEVRREAITLSEIRARFVAAAPELGVIVLDACRNNPFSDSGLTERGLSRSQGGAGILVAYATDPGNVAYDGKAENSLFTEAILDNVGTPGLDVRLMFGRVRQQVLLKSGGRQIPWVEEAVLGVQQLNPAPGAAPADTGFQRDMVAWQRASATGDAAAYESYAAAFPDGLFRDIADERLARLRDAGGRRTEAVGADEVAALIRPAERARIAAALRVLGYLEAGAEAGDDAALTAALAAYAGQSGAAGPVRLAALYQEAADAMAVLGGATAQRLKTDLAALAGIDRTLAMAEGAERELTRLARTDPGAAAALEGAAKDIAAIRSARETVLERLDGSRAYYAGLLERAWRYFQPELAVALSGMGDGDGASAAEQGLAQNSRIFIRHAFSLSRSEEKRSYAWLSDFLPRN